MPLLLPSFYLSSFCLDFIVLITENVTLPECATLRKHFREAIVSDIIYNTLGNPISLKFSLRLNRVYLTILEQQCRKADQIF